MKSWIFKVSLFSFLVTLPFVSNAQDVSFAEDLTVEATVRVYKKQKLPPARYAAQQAKVWYSSFIKTHPTDFLIIFLGKTNNEIWTVEMGDIDDASETIFFNFVRTFSNSHRKMQKIMSSFSYDNKEKRLSPKALEEALLKNLWKQLIKHKDKAQKLQPIQIKLDQRPALEKMENNDCSIHVTLNKSNLCYYASRKGNTHVYEYEIDAFKIKKSKK